MADPSLRAHPPEKHDQPLVIGAQRIQLATLSPRQREKFALNGLSKSLIGFRSEILRKPFLVMDFFVDLTSSI
jgi:hypothetical protein